MSSLPAIEFAPIDPTDDQKRKFRLAIMANVGRKSLDPLLKIYTDRDGWGAITKKNTTEPSGKRVHEETCVQLNTDGTLTLTYDVESVEEGLARTIRADIAARERREAIRDYCEETGASPIDAEMVIAEHILSSPRYEQATELLIDYIQHLDECSVEDSILKIDAFEFGELTDRIINSFVAL